MLGVFCTFEGSPPVLEVPPLSGTFPIQIQQNLERVPRLLHQYSPRVSHVPKGLPVLKNTQFMHCRTSGRIRILAQFDLAVPWPACVGQACSTQLKQGRPLAFFLLAPSCVVAGGLHTRAFTHRGVLSNPMLSTYSIENRGLPCFAAKALWTVFGYKDDSDLWWWESEDVTSNIFLHSCVDFLAFGRKNSDGRDQAPVAKVSLDEKLSKVIGRACTSPFRHVVVYEEANDRQLRNPCPLICRKYRPLENHAFMIGNVT